jgi:hypothetical protein
VIDAPVETVFAYLDDPENSLALVPRLVEVNEVAPLPNGGHGIEYVALGRRGAGGGDGANDALVAESRPMSSALSRRLGFDNCETIVVGSE